MKKFLALVVLFAVGCASSRQKTEMSAAPTAKTKASSVTISRVITVKTCPDDKSPCVGPVVKDPEKSRVSLPMEPFTKGTAKGLTAFEEYRTMEQGVLFTSEIRITKNEGEDGYYVYMMLRSGSTKARKGIVKTFFVPKISQLAETRIEDKTIRYQVGTLQAELIVGPK